ncbi:uncharacterized protein LOC125574870 isoform X1 [Brassica napus]|uniref:uncharacterized protein LOC106376780 isoform X1 n=2 Tax=Brassica napus TaxID=3708 RepID=UPI000BBF175E|nr:uncharacterized protein LOC106376780 isoform X1 [Brassica napus]XP_048627205.1 uncharacterized protein LOC125574870 isoform X1 [Brassica napus]
MQMNTSELICQVVSEAEIFLSASDVKDNYMDASLLPKCKRFQTVIFLERVCHCNVQASQIHQKLVGVGVELKIILATRINPKFVGCLFLNATSGTYYLDNETLASETFLAGLVESIETSNGWSYMCTCPTSAQMVTS